MRRKSGSGLYSRNLVFIVGIHPFDGEKPWLFP
jgi:hypothetical protein